MSTQFYQNITQRTPMQQQHKSRLPALNVDWRNEAVVADIVFSDTRANDDDSTMAQIFTGRTTLFAECYGMKAHAEFVNPLEDQIRKREQWINSFLTVHR